MKRLLVFGAGGQVGRELLAARLPEGWSIVGRDHAAVDVVDAAAVSGAVVRAGADLVINAAAYTAVDRAESERDRAFAVNDHGAGHVATACASVAVPLIHLSTDYVFDGVKSGAYAEHDHVNPMSVYGASKADGERAVRARQPEHIILRTSWVFAAHGNNFVHTMLRLGTERHELRVVADQHGGPTPASDIAATCIAIARAIADGTHAWGTYHYAGTPSVSWHGFAAAIFAAAARSDRAAPALVPITTAEYPGAAKRPLNSVLDCGKIAREFGIAQPDWRPAMERAVAELLREGIGT